jgi:hypothetical protein
MRVLALLLLVVAVPLAHAEEMRLATFVADVTPPIGHPCMGGGIAPAAKVEDPLFAHGFVVLGQTKPMVVVAIDWCEIRNDAYDRWRNVLAEAVDTDRERVLLTALHQHDAPIADLQAQRILDEAKAKGKICDLAFHEKAVQRVAAAAKESLAKAKPITHVGTGQAKVEQVASNRRYLGPDGKPRFDRLSRTGDPKIRAAEEGTIDPWLKTLSFWNGNEPLLGVSGYAVHPMSYYGRGGVSADFIGLARKRRQQDLPETFQMYVSGCSGNVTAGKYNDGSVANRPVLAERLYSAMKEAWSNTVKTPIGTVGFRNEKLRLEPRDGPGFTVADLRKKLSADRPFDQCLAAFGLSWRMRADRGATIDLPVVSLGNACLVLLPAEAYVEYQLLAQKLRPDAFVLVMGYGESAPGYIPTEKHIEERDGNLSDWNWVAPGCEMRMTESLKKALAK